MAYGPGQDPLAESVTCRSGLASLRDGRGGPLDPPRGLGQGSGRPGRGKCEAAKGLDRDVDGVEGGWNSSEKMRKSVQVDDM